MAEQKKGAAPKKKSAAAQKAAETKAENKRKSFFRRQLSAVTFLLFGLYLLACLVAGRFFPDQAIGGVVGEFFYRSLLGILGTAAYLLPIFFIYIGLLNAFGKKDRSYLARKTAALLFTVALAGTLHLFSPALEATGAAVIPALFEQGNTALLSGGVIGGVLTRFLLPMGDLFGAAMIYLAVGILCAVVLLNVTVEGILRAMFPNREAKKAARAERRAEKAAERERAAAERARERQEKQWLDEYRHQNANAADSRVAPKELRRQPGDLPLEGEGEAPPPAGPALPQPPTFMPRRRTGLLAAEPEAAPAAEAPPALPFDPDPPAAKPAPAPALVQEEELSDAEAFVDVYRVPPLSLLTREPGPGPGAGREEMVASSGKILETLRNFGVEATLLGTSRGPAVTRYELAPAAGVKISKITNLSDDIALSLAAIGVRIEAPIPGKAAIGIEVPNQTVSTVHLRSVLESDAFRTAQSPLTICLGKDIAGQPVVGDIAKMPHLLIAGATGAGKSVCINSLLMSLLYKAKPSELRLILIDPKVVELGVYNGIPHLMIPVVNDPKKAAGALSWAVGEMQKRYQLFAERGVKDITGYNLLSVGDDEITPLPRVVIVIDELADLMMTAPAEVEDAIQRLAQMARAAGMHLVIATQRPTVNVITGTIKANVPSRISFAVSSQIDSRTILDAVGAEKLIGKGDMLYYPQGAVKPLRVQGCLVTDKEVESVVEDIKRQNHHQQYDQQVIEQIERESERNGRSGSAYGEEESQEDELLHPAIDVILESGVASVSLLQRRLKLGYARAARIMDEIEERGIVGPSEGSKPRQIRITVQQWQEMKLRRMDEDL
ncbi:MAG: DNA translocase FtsK [Clostridiales bacterium]|nr:DNA translocase FtsK [Clostridiales bacterium]